MSLTLFYHPLASFCHKVLIALYENEIEFEKRLINLGDGADRAELQTLWPFCKFPVIRDRARGRELPETTIIIEYLDHFFAGERRLIPAEWEAALEVRLWDRVFDNYVQIPMQRLVSDRMRGAKGDLSAERATLETAYAMIDRRMESRAWIGGHRFTMADCAAAPALFFAGAVQPFAAKFSHLSAYFDRLTDRPSYRRVIDEAKPYFSLFPYADDIPQRFR